MQGLHLVNAVVIVVAWLWAFGLLLVGLFRPLRLSSRLALRLMVGALWLQVLLGAAMYGLLEAQHIPVVHRHSGLKRMGVGVVAALLGSLSLWQYQQKWVATAACGLVMLMVGMFG